MAAIKELLRSTASTFVGTLGALGLRRALLRWPLPPTDETQALPDMRHPVEVRIDRWGVPHIYAEDATDLFFAQGYCHARDRLWQMELNRRLARGELAEMFGARAVDVDRFLRRLGFRHDAEQDAGKLGDEERTALTAYVAGVNAYVARHRRPVEFVVLRRTPRPWAVVDSLAFARYMGWSLTVNWETELIRARLAEALGEDHVAGLLPESATLVELGGGASNNWVVAPGRSATGRPLLANDPHLRPRMPGLWHMNHLHGGGYDVAGATLPGAPGVLIGHNEHVAWGITVAGTDCQDLVVEKADPRQPRRFAFRNEWYEAEVRREEIAVKGQAVPLVEEVVRTRHGPLLNGVLGIPADGPPLALRSTTDGNPTTMAAILRMNRAADADAFREALREWHFPALNFVFADTEGRIGYQLAGQVPIRAKGDGFLPAPGWAGTHEWVGTVPFDEMPAATDPKEGFLATANARPEPAGKHFLGRDWCDDGRLRRIRELLQSKPLHDVADFQSMMADVVSLPAQEIARRLTGGARIGLDGPTRYLVDWDGSLAADSVPAAIYEVFRLCLMQHVHRDLPAPVRDMLLGKGVCEGMTFASVFHAQASSHVLATLDGLLADGKGPVMVEALNATFAQLRERFGTDPAAWRWGDLHQTSFRHVLGSSPLLDRLLRLNRGPFPIGGDQDTIAQSGVDPWQPFEASTFTVAYRQIFDVGNWDEAMYVLPTGQSGHPGSSHYDDMTTAWRACEFVPLPFSRTAVEKATAETVRLTPEH